MKISVCMATRNGALYIKEQIDSILPQLNDEDELVISDDGSSDSTLEIINSYNAKQIRLFNGTFRNPVRNFEYALTKCVNEIIFLADQDDLWYPDKIKTMRAALNDCDLVVCDCRIVNEKLKTITPSFFSQNNSQKGLLKNFLKSSFVGCCMAFRKNVLTKALPFPKNIPIHDQWIGLVAQKYFKVNFIPHILVDHRRHDRNYSTTGGQSVYSFKKKVISRIKLVRMLIER